tara:strand:+ start:2618 stop:3109 length:492 start_codon:yes stop_codon:yes gene_type:complete
MSTFAKNGQTVEAMIENRMIWFKKNGSIDKRCSAYKSGIIDENCEIVQVVEESGIDELPPLEDISTSESCYSLDEEEMPEDQFFYGKLTESVKNIDTLVEIMSNGIKSYKKHMETKNDTATIDFADILDSWFDHDNLRNNYFDHLLKDKDFDKFAEVVISKAF